MNWTEPPEVTVPLSGWGYFGYALLGLFALAVLIGAALLIRNHETGGGLVVFAAGILFYAPAAFAYLRTVESGWNIPNVVIWVGLIGLGVAASWLIYKLPRDNFDVGTLVPAGGATVATLAAAVLDKVNEHLAHIPMAWATVAGLVLLVALLFARMSGALR